MFVSALDSDESRVRHGAFYALQVFTSSDVLPTEQADANLELLCRMRMLGKCARLLFPIHFLEGEQKVMEGSKSASRTMYIIACCASSTVF